MEKPRIYLFTSATCPNCPPAKEFLERFTKGRDDVIVEELSMMTKEGRRKAEKYDVMSVPTFIIEGPHYPQPIGLRGLQSESVMNKYIDLSRGIETEKKPTLMEKIFGGRK